MAKIDVALPRADSRKEPRLQEEPMSVRALESNTTRVSLVILAVIATGAALYWLRGILTPLALAVFLAVMVDGFARVIRMRLPWVSERAALPLAIVLSVLLFGISTFVIAENATSFVFGPSTDS